MSTDNINLDHIQIQGKPFSFYAEQLALNIAKSMLLKKQKTRVPQSIKSILDQVDIGKTTLLKAKKDGLLQAYKFKGSKKVYFYLDEVIDLFYPE